jgi:hypothetical protein
MKSIKSIHLSLNNSVFHIITGCYTVKGSAVCLTKIIAGGGSFTVRSENIGALGPGKQYK